jgi:UDP-GlcNAc:undecaprenyl-phosphate/decaprenyl-phosphate GlcNAc-1-phosphate transferase
MNEALLKGILESNLWISLGVTFCGGWVLNHFLSSKVLLISKRKKLFTAVNHRSSHADPVSALGGVSIFIVVLIAILMILGLGYSSTMGFLLLSTFILFLSGLKDDLIGSRPISKLLVQIIAGLLIVFISDFQIFNLSGFLGIESISFPLMLVFELLFVLFIVNAYNFIDGIDGLAGTMGLVSLSLFAALFYTTRDLPYLFFIAALMGSLVSFMFFNLGAPKKKMFMGDTGSLVIGLVLAVFSLKVMADMPQNNDPLNLSINLPLFVLTLLIIPILDTLRIIIVRISMGQKPWKADRNHMHHVLLDTGMTHIQATAFLGFMQLFAVGGYLLVNGLGLIALHFYVLGVYLNYTALIVWLSQTKELPISTHTSKKLAGILRSLLP